VWYQQQAALLRQDGTRELDAAAAALQAGRLPEAQTAMGRARAVLAGRTPADLHARVAELTSLLHWATELDRIRQDRWAVQGGRFTTQAVGRYAESFAAHGLNVEEDDPEEVAQAVRTSLIRVALTEALDDWRGIDQDRAAVVLEVLRRVDPDPFRSAVREAAWAQDRQALKRLAAEADVGSLTPASVVLLAEAVGGAEAVAFLRRARIEHRSDFWLTFILSNKLKDTRDLAGAEEALWAALTARPDSLMALNNLGFVLRLRKNLPEAEKVLRSALRLEPDFVYAHTNLGLVLQDQGDLAKAEEEFRTALRVEDSAITHNNLGSLLLIQGNLPVAEEEFRIAISLDPALAQPHFGLGQVLLACKDLPGAEKEFLAATRLAPRYGDAYAFLGYVREARGDQSGAEKAYDTATRLASDNDFAHNRLGCIRRQRNDLAGAEKAFRAGVRHFPNDPLLRVNLGLVLRDQGQFSEAVVQLRRGCELGAARFGWGRSSADWLKEAEALADLDRRLPGVLGGEVTASPAEIIAFAKLCARPCKQLYAASTLLFARAFAADPGLAHDLERRHRYQAAGAAALAGCGKGKDSGQPGGARAALRRQALTWLRDDLAAWAERVKGTNPAHRRAAGTALKRWRNDPDLACLREPAELANLPPEERAACRQLWADVARLLADLTPRCCCRWRPSRP
jgi:Flp pilus assembly protein TadD